MADHGSLKLGLGSELWCCGTPWGCRGTGSGGCRSRKGTNGVSANGVTANFVFFDRGTFGVFPLTYFYLPRSARACLVDSCRVLTGSVGFPPSFSWIRGSGTLAAAPGPAVAVIGSFASHDVDTFLFSFCGELRRFAETTNPRNKHCRSKSKLPAPRVRPSRADARQESLQNIVSVCYFGVDIKILYFASSLGCFISTLNK